ncbi:uncharacterized protein LOC110094792 [Dendrobium catenatum]|uniref:VOC domain-containing protein n=1 Tax=Dendrobium catenatum TaxID=906689 RepID=A0A2I0WPN4_9ASPA|nr:uncharacterized protein LOC110094792 [Dendrobium catenatum]PKU77606.1 hypothetical protein MA16_Dca012678 [Dendrobium catenatum]
MAIRCFTLPLSPNATYQRVPISRSKVSFPTINHCWFAGEGMNRKAQLLKKVKVSAERELLVGEADSAASAEDVGIISIHHVGILCENLEKSLDFYQSLLGLKINEARPHDKLPYRGAWLWVGDEMIHLMELPNPDPLTGRPEHGGRDRHSCIAIRNVSKLKERFDKAGIKYTLSRSGRPAIFTRDPDGNALEFTQID